MSPRLGQPVGHHPQHLRVPGHAQVAALHLHVLHPRCGPIVAAGLPGHHAVTAAVDGRGGHRRGGGQPAAQRRAQPGVLAVEQAVHPGGMRLRRDAVEGGAQSDHLAHPQTAQLGQLAGVDAAQAPADQRDGRVRPADQALHICGQLAEPAVDVAGRSGVPAATPVHRRVAQALAVRAQRRHRMAVAGQAGEDDHWMAVTRQAGRVGLDPVGEVFGRGPQGLGAQQHQRRPGGGAAWNWQ